MILSKSIRYLLVVLFVILLGWSQKASAKGIDLYTNNMYQSTSQVVSNYEESNSRLSKKVRKELKKAKLSMKSCGVQTKKVEVKFEEPEPVIEEQEVNSNDYSAFLESDTGESVYKEVPNDEPGCRSWFFSYMGYTATTCRSSAQYKLLNSPYAYSDQVTGLRMYKGRICIAMGSFYADTIGTRINLHMKNGAVIRCVLGEQKSDKHTDDTHRYHRKDGSVAEMVVDYKYFKSTKQYPKELKGEIAFVEVLK